MKILDTKQVEILQDAVQKVLSEFQLGEIKANEDQSNTFKVIASDETIDRDGEIIMVDGWDCDNFLKNPVIFIDHKSWSVMNIAGKATRVYTEDNKLIVEGIFTNKTEAGQIAQALYNDGFLKTVSVGFFVKQRNELNDRVIEKAELYELSFVSVPANPNAVSLDGKMYKKGVELGLINEEIKEYATVEDVKMLSEKLDKVLSLLDDKSEEDKKKLQDFEYKEFLQGLNRSVSEQLRALKKPV